MTAGERLRRLEAVEIGTMSVGDAAAALRDITVVRGRTDQLEAAITRRVGELHALGQAAPASDLLGRQSTTSRQTVERSERRAEALGNTPSLEHALSIGRVGVEHADAVATAAGRLDDARRAVLFDRDDVITAMASSQSPETFRRRLGKLVGTITNDDGLAEAEQQAKNATASIKRNDDTGMHHLFAKLTPEQGNRIRRRLDHEIATMAKLPEFGGLRDDQLRARALDRLICGTQTSTVMAPAELAIQIDLLTVTSGHHENSVCEYSDGSPLPVETARRHACDANIIPVVLDGDGMPLDVGRAKRFATKEQRLALRSMYRTCAIDGCGSHFDLCHIHHLLEWDDLG
ncbi:MAG: hypothetical protein WA964_06990, partial [Ilumatobacter sp.]|uniref:DUF222 domain-containing protein n=1 Tax=Ilumatobacter sp. TaxID=1967498 RepID=UPI003C787C80